MIKIHINVSLKNMCIVYVNDTFCFDHIKQIQYRLKSKMKQENGTKK